MALRTFYLYPVTLHKASPDATYDAQDTGSWNSTDPAAIDDVQGAADGSATENTHPWGPSGGYNTRYRFASYSLSTPPPGLSINSITVRAIVTNHSSNASTVDGDFRVFVITAAGATRTLGSANTILGLRASEYAVNQEWREISYTWAVNPSTGVAWTLADLVDLKVGVRTLALTDPLSASNPLAHVTSIYVEVEGVTTAGNVEQVRDVGSWELRMARRPLRILTAERLPLRFGDKGPGDAIWLAHDAIPTPDGLGSAVQAGLRSGYIVTKRTRRPGDRSVRFELLDPQGYAVTFWSPMVTDIAIDEQDTGIALLHRGGGWTVERNAVGYAKRPDGLWTDRAVNKPRYHKDYGLLISGGVITAAVPNNTFSQYGGGAFTGWTSSLSGGATLAQDTASYLFDAAGLRSSAKITCGAGGTGYVNHGAVTGLTTAHRILVGVKAVGSLSSPYMLLRFYAPNVGAPITTYTYNFATGVWDVGALASWYRPGDTPGVPYEYWSPSIQPPASGDAILHVGYNTTPNNVINVYAAGIWHDGGFGEIVAREFDVTTVAPVTATADDIWLNNDAAFREWDWNKGSCNFQFTPLWGHTDLKDGGLKRLVMSGSAAAGPFMSIYYYRSTASVGEWIFASPNAAGGYYYASYLCTAAAGNLPTRLTPVSIAVLWTGANGELGLPTYTRRILVNGVRGTDTRNVAGTLPTVVDGETKVWLGRSWGTLAGATLHQYADGYFRHFAIRDWCPPEEMLRRFVG